MLAVGLVDKAFLDGAGSSITWRPATGTVVLGTDERLRGSLTFCSSKQGPRYKALVTVAEPQNFGASLLPSCSTLEQLYRRVDMNHSQDKAAKHFNRAGCMNRVDKISDDSNPEIVTYPPSSDAVSGGACACSAALAPRATC